MYRSDWNLVYETQAEGSGCYISLHLQQKAESSSSVMRIRNYPKR